jgi:hypothetical protein
MTAANRDGSGTVDAFGTIRRTTHYFNLWSQSAPPSLQISGVWGTLATMTIFVAVVAAVPAILHGSEAAGGITGIAALAIAVFALVDVFNLHKAIPRVKASFAMSNDLGTPLGLVQCSLLHAPELTPWAFAATAVTFAAAVTVSRSWRILYRIVVVLPCFLTRCWIRYA